MRNITVVAKKKGKQIEVHACSFPSTSYEVTEYPGYGYNAYKVYPMLPETIPCGANNTKLQFTNLEVAVGYTFTITVCNYAGCVNTSLEHDTTNWNCGPEDGHKVISTRQICDSKEDCPIGKRDEKELICQGSPFARNISLTIFLYMFLVLLLFALVKKKEYFKCRKHPNNPHDMATVGAEVLKLRTLMTDKSGVNFKVSSEVNANLLNLLYANFRIFTLNVMKTKTLTP